MTLLCADYWTDFKNIGFNILGGVAVIGLERLIFFLRRKYKFYKLKRLFGQDIIKDYKLTYGQFVLSEVYDSKGNKLHFPFRKIETNTFHSIIDPVSFSDTKAAKYIASLIAKETGNYAELISDREIGNNIDVSFCATGGYSNLKSLEVLKSEKNKFFDFYLPQNGIVGIIDLESGEKTINTNPEYDLGLIIKVNNKFFPNRTQICIAGLNIWGTSGTAWYLANKWDKIYKLVKNKEFGIIIKVKKGNDQESELIKIKVNK